ncbi:unnamed protein product [Tilletia controversa]|nr:unnamed protein product [Tilletia controversa]
MPRRGHDHGNGPRLHRPDPSGPTCILAVNARRLLEDGRGLDGLQVVDLGEREADTNGHRRARRNAGFRHLQSLAVVTTTREPAPKLRPMWSEQDTRLPSPIPSRNIASRPRRQIATGSKVSATIVTSPAIKNETASSSKTPSGSSGTRLWHSRPAPDENDVPRVRNARSLRVSGYESSESEDEEAPTRYVRAVDRGQAHPPPTVGVPGARHRAVVAHKAAVYIGDARDRFELHVDGGSPLSMITPQALRSIAPFAEVHPPEPLKIRGYRGDDYQRTIGVVVLPVSFPTVNRVTPVTCRFEFHVVADCTRGWILGVDNMKADGIDARSRMERLEFEKRPDAEVKLLQAHDAAANPSAVAHLLCAEDTMVGPRTTRFVKVLGVKEDQIVRPWVFMGKEPESGGAQVPWCVVGPNTNEVELRNDADTPLVLKQGDHLGDLVLLDQESESVEQLQACRGSMDKAGQKEVDGVMRSVAEVRALTDLQGWSSRGADVRRVTLYTRRARRRRRPPRDRHQATD